MLIGLILIISPLIIALGATYLMLRLLRQEFDSDRYP
jgi:hypothetical protein